MMPANPKARAAEIPSTRCISSLLLCFFALRGLEVRVREGESLPKIKANRM